MRVGLKRGNISYAFFGATNFSRELLLFLIKNNFIPKAIFSIPEEFTITYNKKRVKVKNVNYANLKEVAEEYGVPHYEVDSGMEGKKLKNYEDIIKNLNLDLILVLGWYYMVPKSIRNLARYGAWGIHASLLPKYAGGAPLVWAIINGEKETGVTLFRLDDGIDDGDIIAQKSFSIDDEDTIKEVYAKATEASKQILAEVLDDIENVRFTPQDKSKIEVYPQRTPEDGLINWNQEAKKIYDFIRAQTLPYPCAFTIINGKKIKVISSKIVDMVNYDYLPGEIVCINNKILVAAKDKFLELGIIDDGSKITQFKDYVMEMNLSGKIFNEI
ncbi:MAG: methionyl-tRNA formyltransferase [Candidatus Calescibacterium sp.]|jgi:methionyl-tRNA formyltransferase